MLYAQYLIGDIF